MQISAIIPTHNRPQLLKEALTSITGQLEPASEIVVVDDGSTEPVNEQRLQAEFGPLVRVLRNETPRGLAWARNQGVQHTHGDVLVQLDDDDLLAPETLHEGKRLLEADPDIEVIFLGARGFGARADYFNRGQISALRRVVELGQGLETEPGVIAFGDNLLEGLLVSVPTAFQHVMTRRSVWEAVSRLRCQSYCLDPDVPNEQDAMHRINALLCDSEWALYAAATPRKTALINRPRYLARCDGQGQASCASQRERQLYQGISIKEHLYQASSNLPDIARWCQRIRSSLAAGYFNGAYHFFYHHRNRSKALSFLSKSFMTKPSITTIKFGLRLLLPAPASEA